MAFSGKDMTFFRNIYPLWKYGITQIAMMSMKAVWTSSLIHGEHKTELDDYFQTFSTSIAGGVTNASFLFLELYFAKKHLEELDINFRKIVAEEYAIFPEDVTFEHFTKSHNPTLQRQLKLLTWYLGGNIAWDSLASGVSFLAPWWSKGYQVPGLENIGGVTGDVKEQATGLNAVGKFLTGEYQTSKIQPYYENLFTENKMKSYEFMYANPMWFADMITTKTGYYQLFKTRELTSRLKDFNSNDMFALLQRVLTDKAWQEGNAPNFIFGDVWWSITGQDDKKGSHIGMIQDKKVKRVVINSLGEIADKFNDGDIDFSTMFFIICNIADIDFVNRTPEEIGKEVDQIVEKLLQYEDGINSLIEERVRNRRMEERGLNHSGGSGVNGSHADNFHKDGIQYESFAERIQSEKDNQCIDGSYHDDSEFGKSPSFSLMNSIWNQFIGPSEENIQGNKYRRIATTPSQFFYNYFGGA